MHPGYIFLSWLILIFFFCFFMFHRNKSQVYNFWNDPFHVRLSWQVVDFIASSSDSKGQWLLLSCHLIWQLQEIISVLQCSEL